MTMGDNPEESALDDEAARTEGEGQGNGSGDGKGVDVNEAIHR